MQTVDVIQGFKYMLPCGLAVPVPDNFPLLETEYVTVREKYFGGREMILNFKFPWDGASGALDTDGVIIPSAFHDAICELTKEGAIPWKPWREWGDNLYFHLCKLNGVNWIRARAHLWAIRKWSESERAKKGGDKIRTVPCNGVRILHNLKEEL